jgi:hypothetical protein
MLAMKTEDAPGPTLQTVAKLRPDPLRALLLKGPRRGLTVHQWEAALAIRRAFEHITAPVSVALGNPEQPYGQKVYTPGWSDIGPLAKLDVVVQYNAWADEMGARKMRIGPVIDAVVDDDIGPVAPLKRALQLYARLAGWVSAYRAR